MNHSEIDAQGVIDRYVTGDLVEAELETFEEHMLTCSTCQDQLELSFRLQEGVREAFRVDSVQRTSLVAPGLRSESANGSATLSRRYWALAAAVLGLVAAASSFGWFEQHRRSGALQVQLSETQERFRREAGGERLVPITNVALVPLDVVRGEEAQVGPIIYPGPEVSSVLFLMQVAEAGPGPFDVRIEFNGVELARVTGAVPSAEGELSLAMGVEGLEPGQYLLTAQRQDRTGEVTRYGFEVAQRP